MKTETEFEDIRIVEIDDAKSHRDNAYPGLYHIHLRLSAAPPPQWSREFDHAWSMILYNMKREARVVGKYLVIICAPEEIEPYHKEHLKNAVNRANEFFRAYEIKRKADAEKAKREQEQERERIAVVAKSVKFD